MSLVSKNPVEIGNFQLSRTSPLTMFRSASFDRDRGNDLADCQWDRTTNATVQTTLISYSFEPWRLQQCLPVPIPAVWRNTTPPRLES